MSKILKIHHVLWTFFDGRKWIPISGSTCLNGSKWASFWPNRGLPTPKNPSLSNLWRRSTSISKDIQRTKMATNPRTLMNRHITEYWRNSLRISTSDSMIHFPILLKVCWGKQNDLEKILSHFPTTILRLHTRNNGKLLIAGVSTAISGGVAHQQFDWDSVGVHDAAMKKHTKGRNQLWSFKFGTCSRISCVYLFQIWTTSSTCENKPWPAAIAQNVISSTRLIPRWSIATAPKRNLRSTASARITSRGLRS